VEWRWLGENRVEVEEDDRGEGVFLGTPQGDQISLIVSQVNSETDMKIVCRARRTELLRWCSFVGGKCPGSCAGGQPLPTTPARRVIVNQKDIEKIPALS
jgi:hypothetical protein